jgi:hypothetical protein
MNLQTTESENCSINHDLDFIYLHPQDIENTWIEEESIGDEIKFRCPRCGNKSASFNLKKRVGTCLRYQMDLCGLRVISLHSTYDNCEHEDLFDEIYRSDKTRISRSRSNYKARLNLTDLSLVAFEYLESRGINKETVSRFEALQEVEYAGKLWLAWPTIEGGYQLRSLLDKSKRTPAGHKQCFSLFKMSNNPNTIVITEGLVSAMSHFQQLPQKSRWYVSLNSVANYRKFLDQVEIFKLEGISKYILALDNDEAGKSIAIKMEEYFISNSIEFDKHFVPLNNSDWNDLLCSASSKIKTVSKESENQIITQEIQFPAPSELLNAAVYENLLQSNNRIVIADKCGGGKTLASAEFMAKHYNEGCLYAAERNEQLDSMMDLLITKHNVPPELIKIYNKFTISKAEIRKSLNNYPIVLVTHARLTIDDPVAFCYFSNPVLEPRSHFIIDESVSMASIMRLPEFLVKGVLAEANIKLGTRFSDDEARLILAKIRDPLVNLSHVPYKKQGISYSAVQNLPHDIIEPRAKQYIYELAFFQIFVGNYSSGDKGFLDILVPLAPHQAWGHLFKNVLVLDATAKYTPFLYDGFQIVGRDFDFSLIEKTSKYILDYNFSKTNLRKNQNTFLDNDLNMLKQVIGDFGENPYIVSFKEFEEDIEDRLGKTVVHYGMTRGSNDYRDCDSVIMIGSYRLPPKYLELAHFLYPNLDPLSIPVAHWLQEIYRSRIRDEKPINLIYLGDQQSTKRFKSVLGRPALPFVTVMSPRDTFEEILRKELTEARRGIINGLKESGKCNLREIARKFTHRDINNARKAYRGLINDEPRIERVTSLINDVVTVKTTL